MKLENIIPIVLVLTSCGTAREKQSYDVLRAGYVEYANKNYTKAAEIYATAPDDPTALFGLGNAQHFLVKLNESVAAYDAALTHLRGDTAQGRVLYNKGTSLALTSLISDSLSKQALATFNSITIEGNDIALNVNRIVTRDSLMKAHVKMQGVSDSTMYAARTTLRNALKITPKNDDARYNLMAVQSRIDKSRKEQEEKRKKDGENKNDEQKLSAMAMRLVQRADSLVDQYKFNDALDVLEGGLKRDPSLKKEEQYMQKLETVTKSSNAK